MSSLSTRRCAGVKARAEVPSHDRTLGLYAAYGLAGLASVPLTLLPLMLSTFLWQRPAAMLSILDPLFLAELLVLCLGGSWLHELLHAAGWAVSSSLDWRRVQIGWRWHAMSPFARVDAPIQARGYRWGVALPGIVLGVVPTTMGLLKQSPLMLWAGVLLTLAALGDALVLLRIRDLPGSRWVQDHPDRIGCSVLPPAGD
jgi:hypothetical protein